MVIDICFIHYQVISFAITSYSRSKKSNSKACSSRDEAHFNFLGSGVRTYSVRLVFLQAKLQPYNKTCDQIACDCIPDF